MLLPKLLGEEAYDKFLKAGSRSIRDTETTISRFWPELSKPAQEMPGPAPDFSPPKPVVARKGAREQTAKAATKKLQKSAVQTRKPF